MKTDAVTKMDSAPSMREKSPTSKEIKVVMASDFKMTEKTGASTEVETDAVAEVESVSLMREKLPTMPTETTTKSTKGEYAYVYISQCNYNDYKLTLLRRETRGKKPLVDASDHQGGKEI